MIHGWLGLWFLFMSKEYGKENGSVSERLSDLILFGYWKHFSRAVFTRTLRDERQI